MNFKMAIFTSHAFPDNVETIFTWINEYRVFLINMHSNGFTHPNGRVLICYLDGSQDGNNDWISKFLLRIEQNRACFG